MCRCIEPHVPWDMVHFPIGPPAIIGVNTAIMEVSQWGDPQIIHFRLGCSIINDPAIDPPFMDANLYILDPLGESLSRRWDESQPSHPICQLSSRTCRPWSGAKCCVRDGVHRPGMFLVTKSMSTCHPSNFRMLWSWIWMNLGKSPFPSTSAKANRHKSELMDLFWLLWLSGRSTVDDDVAATWI